MGRTITPRYRVELRVPGFHFTPAGWDGKHCGRPSDASLRAYVLAFEASTQPGGINAHLGPTTIERARVVRQSDDTIVARYERSGE